MTRLTFTTGRTIRRAGLILLLGALIAAAGLAMAQGGPLVYNSAVTGSLTAETPFVIYTFTGAAGDFVSASALSLSEGFSPGLALLGPNQRQMALSESDPFGGGDPGTARLSHRLAQDGLHSLLVSSSSGAAGEFVLRLSGQPAPAASPILQPGTPTVVNVVAAGPLQAYQFNISPGGPTTLQLSPGAAPFPFTAQVIDGDGQVVIGLLGSGLEASVLTFPAGTGLYEVRLTGLDATQTGVVELLVTTGAAAGPGPLVATPTAIPPEATAEVSGPSVCQASSDQNVNVRGGPNTIYDVVGALLRGSTLEVIGRNFNASWYVVDFNGRQGWVAASVIDVEGPCDALPLIAEPPTPTPIPPTATPTVLAPSISFTSTVDPATAYAPGTCFSFFWTVSNVRAVYFQGQGVSGESSREVCPTVTTTYVLRVERLDGGIEERTITANILLPTSTP